MTEYILPEDAFKAKRLTREEMIARHDELVDAYTNMEDAELELRGDEVLGEIAALEAHLMVTAPPMSDEDFEAMLRGEG